ncbi:hypothetical protein [Clostridium sp. UBA1056]|uniref:hypothetical protein n=1 Tax=unclassified Clostridium TaxID=2614128 RepID=UPI0032168FBD
MAEELKKEYSKIAKENMSDGVKGMEFDKVFMINANDMISMGYKGNYYKTFVMSNHSVIHSNCEMHT